MGHGSRLRLNVHDNGRARTHGKVFAFAQCLDSFSSNFLLLELDRPHRHHSGDCMLVHELGLAVAAQQHAKIVKPSDISLKLDPVHQKDRNGGFRLPDCIQKRVLQVLLFFAHLYTRLLIGPAFPAKRVATA